MRGTLLTADEFDRLVDHLRRLNDLAVCQPFDHGPESDDFADLMHRLLNDGDERERSSA